MIRVNGKVWDPTIIRPFGNQAIPLFDLAFRLARMPRWGGAFRVGWWSVLHHTHVVRDLCSFVMSKLAGDDFRSRVLLHALMHDAHEAATCDVPSPWKDSTLRAKQHSLDVSLYRDSLSLSMPSPAVLRFVKKADKLAMHAEGWLVGPEYWRARHPEAPPPRHVEIVDAVLKELGSFHQIAHPESKGVQQFIDDVDSLASSLGGKCTRYRETTS